MNFLNINVLTWFRRDKQRGGRAGGYILLFENRKPK